MAIHIEKWLYSPLTKLVNKEYTQSFWSKMGHRGVLENAILRELLTKSKPYSTFKGVYIYFRQFI